VFRVILTVYPAAVVLHDMRALTQHGQCVHVACHLYFLVLRADFLFQFLDGVQSAVEAVAHAVHGTEVALADGRHLEGGGGGKE
jgi:hypothetical protein